MPAVSWKPWHSNTLIVNSSLSQGSRCYELHLNGCEAHLGLPSHPLTHKLSQLGRRGGGMAAPHSTALSKSLHSMFLCWAVRPCCFQTQ